MTTFGSHFNTLIEYDNDFTFALDIACAIELYSSEVHKTGPLLSVMRKLVQENIVFSFGICY